MRNNLTWKIGGEAGFGIMSAGTMLAKALTRLGYNIIATNEYPSLVRGGHNVVSLRVSVEPIASPDRSLDLLVALNAETIALHKAELSDGAVVVYDPHDATLTAADFPRAVTLVSLPLTDIVRKLGGETVMRNTIALGATVALIGLPLESLADVIRDQFIKKGQSVVDENVAIAREGFDTVKTAYGQVDAVRLAPPASGEKKLVMNVSEAVGLGAIAAGMKFAAIYPMTPINALISLFADHAAETGIVYKQPEDEIAGINMAIGASLAGARSMVATSGGGFALMVEAVSMAGVMEVPLVIDLGMRPGPATGMPTWTEQGELRMAIHAGHGEFPRAVLAPGDVEEAYKLSVLAFDLADRYQTPVFILTDKYLNESQWQIPEALLTAPVVPDRGKRADAQSFPKDGPFKRYALSVDGGVSPRSFPGMEHGDYLASSYEHDEQGFTTEDAAMRRAMADKRMAKMRGLLSEALPPSVYGDLDADVTFVAWGSVKGPVIEAMKQLKKHDVRSRLVHLSWVYPFPSEAFMSLVNGARRLVSVEGNSTSQLASLVREHAGLDIPEKLTKYDGRQWLPEEIVEAVLKR